MSATATQKTVQPKTTFNYLLDEERLFRYNMRLNNFGRIIISRHHFDNDQMLLTQFGFNWLRAMKAVMVKEVLTKSGAKSYRTVVNRLACEKLSQEQFYNLVDMHRYPEFVAKMYAKPENISFRSIYKAKNYFEKLNSYGHNRNVKLNSLVVDKMLGYLDKKLKPWIQNTQFEFDFKSFLESGKWLVHIKTNSNSGYPDNIKQDKLLMTRYAGSALKVFEDYVASKPINWYKLAFEMGHRTERKDKIRVICMASTIEKLLSSVFSTFLDLTFNELPFNLPRKYGGPDAIMHELKQYDGNLITKDFDAYDTSIPIHIFTILRDWFKKIDNTLAWLLALECDIIIHSVMIVGPDLLFGIFALPSGIGTTQFLGSLIHWLLDFVFGIEYKIAIYQSDDNIGRTSMTQEELNNCIKILEAETKMEVSPYGDKSFYHPTCGRFLQKVMDFDANIFYNHEQRAYTNGIFRERQISDDTVFNLLFNTNDKDVNHKKMVLAYLGNLVSYNQHAPSIDDILAFFYGRRSGFSATQVKWGLTNLEKYMKEYLEVEEHRAMDAPGWLSHFMDEAMAKFTWSSISAKDVHSILVNA